MVESFTGKKITIMGLGLHGGGLASALFFLKEGANLTITDLRKDDVLKPTLKKLESYNIKYVLGEHRDEDFINADIVIKNPGVPSSSPYLKLAKRVESDISIFLERTESPIIAVTGSKGKSSTVSAIYHVLKQVNPKTKLGGNITVSPLTFIDEVDKSTPVILELSSWQLADLKDKNALKASIATVTNIMNDHQNAYNSLTEYSYDKSLIFNNLKGVAILNYDDNFKDYFREKLNREPLYFSNKELPDNIYGAYLSDNKEGWLNLQDDKLQILNSELTLKGEHQRSNLLLAALILYKFGVNSEIIREKLSDFTGISHRMEFFKEIDGVNFYNDSAATIPEAVTAAINSFDKPVRLITGGTDKELDFSNILESYRKAKSIHLLDGTATDKIVEILKKNAIPYFGPYTSLEKLVEELFIAIRSGDIVLFSPGATSFGMFNNEFDRGNQFKDIILSI